MIDIRNASGARLDLAPDQTLLLESDAALLNTDSLPGGFSYPVSFPLSPANAAFLGNGHRADATGRMEVPVWLRGTGVLDRPALLRYGVQNGTVSATLRFDYSAITDKIMSLPIGQVLTEPIDLMPELAELGNRLTARAQWPDRLQAIAGMAPGSFPVVFFPFRDDILMEEGYEASKLGVPNVPYTRPTHANPYTSAYQIDTRTGMGNFSIPAFYLTWVVEALLGKLGYALGGSWSADPSVRKLVLLSNTTLPTPVTVTLVDRLTIEFQQVVPGLHLPDLTVSDFLKAVRQRFGLRVIWDRRARLCRLDRITDLLTAPARDLRGTPRIGRDTLTDADRKGISLTEYVEGLDELRRDVTTKQTIKPVAQTLPGEGLETIESRFGTVAMVRELRPGGNGAYWEVPSVRIPANVTGTLYNGSERKPTDEGVRNTIPGLLLLSYEGLQPDSQGHNYPLATSLPPSGSLALGGRSGWWVGSARAYYTFRQQARTGITARLLPLATALALESGEKLLLDGEQNEQVTMLLDTLQLELPAVNGLVKTKLTGLIPTPGGGNSYEPVPDMVYIELVRADREEAGYVKIDATSPLAYISRKLSTFTVKAWADRAKTTPANLPGTGLRLSTRVRYTPDLEAYTNRNNPEAVYKETLGSVLISTSTQVLQTDFERDYQMVWGPFQGTQDLYRAYKQTFALDPGEGYTLL